MRIKITLFAAMLLLLLLLCNPAYGQTISKDNYEKAVNYLNCKTVELSLKTNADSIDAEGNTNPKNKENYDNYKSDFPCQENSSPDLIIVRLQEIGYTGTKALAEEIVALKQSFNPKWKPDEGVTFLSDTVFKSNRLPRLVEFIGKRKTDNSFPAFQNELKGNLTEILSAADVTNTNVNSNVNTNVNANDNKNPTSNIPAAISTPIDKEEWSNFTFWVSLISLLLLLGLIPIVGALFLNLRELMNKQAFQHTALKVIERRLVGVNPSSISARPVTSSSSAVGVSNSDDIENLKTCFNKLEGLVTVINAKVNQLSTEPEMLYRTEREESSNREMSQEVFYLSTPNQDGSFNEKSAHSSYREGASIYIFIRISHNQAVFELDEREASVKVALAYPAKNIEPACEPQNAYNPKASRIATVQGGLGKAVLDGDKWKVVKKALIRYEY